MNVVDKIKQPAARPKPVRAVERAVSILFLVARSERPVGLTDIARACQLDKATALRLLHTLQRSELVWRDPSTRQYSPGPNVWRLPKSWHNDLRQLSRPHLESLLRSTAESVSLVCRRGLERIVVEVFAAPHELAVVPTMGSAQPLYAGASGQVFMAYMTEEDCKRALDATGLKPISPDTITDRATFLRVLRTVREKGYAISVGGVTVGAAAVAAPVFDSSGTVVAAVSVRGPQVRMSAERMEAMAPNVVRAAATISGQLGYQIDPRAIC